MTVGNFQQKLVNFAAVKEANKREFLGALWSLEGKKALIWDAELMPKFSMFVGFKEIKEQNVQQMFNLQKGSAPTTQVDRLVYILQSDLSVVESFCDNLKSLKRDDQPLVDLFFVPERSILVDKRLTDAKVLQRCATVNSLPITFYTCDEDVLSMENSSCFKDFQVHSDRSFVFPMVSGLLQLQTLYGRFQNVFFKGELAQVTAQLLKQRDEEVVETPIRSAIDTLVIFDRSVDLVTPLLTQLTYEGLIDELFEIKLGAVKLPKEKFSSSDETAANPSEEADRLPRAKVSSELKELTLSRNDDLFVELRDLNFSAVGPVIRKNVRSISEQMEARHTATVREYKEFVKRLPQLQMARQSAGVHTAIAELIKEQTTDDLFLESVNCEQEVLNCVETDKVMPHIEDSIAKALPISKVLRLICLQSLITDGLKPRVLEQYKRELLQSYGYHHLSLLMKLERSGLLRMNTGKPTDPSAPKRNDFSFASVSKALKLIVEDVNEQKPNDIAYVYSGYAPILVRLCQYLYKPGWKSLQEILKKLPGPSGTQEQTASEQHLSLIKKNVALKPSRGISADDEKFTLVLVIGGITRAEISALRFLSTQDETNHFLVATTKIISGSSLISSLGEESVAR